MFWCSLADVSEEHMSERSNTAAAMSFLHEMELRKKDEEEQSDELPEKIVFKKTSSSNKEEAGASTSVSDQTTFRNTKVIMPEYVVGRKVLKPKKRFERKQNQSKELKLEHLLDEDEEED